MNFNLKPGLIGEKQETVTEDNVALKYASGTVSVYATPAMIGLMEFAAHSCVDAYLPGGFATVGTHLDVKHLAATPLGMKVTARAELLAIEGRRLTFQVEAYDEKEKVGEGTHERYIVELDKFMSRVNAKIKGN